jgi:aminopeptidase YwaD
LYKIGENIVELSEICIERPLGTKGNNDVINILSYSFEKLEYTTIELPFKCTVWQSFESFIEQNGNRIKIYPSPFSEEIKGIFSLKYVSNVKELKNIQEYNGILVFINELSENSLMPKDFPFYFPDEHKEIYETLEKINPKGIITITGQDSVSGLNPFPIFEDANFKIPTAYVSSLDNISDSFDISIEINSKRSKEISKQIIFRKEGVSKDIILIVAHMDTKYFTNGALDNAGGLYTLYEIADLIKNKSYNNTIEIVPFNGEDSPEASGQLAYLTYLEDNNYNIKTVINIDGAGHIGSKNMFSFYNFEENMRIKLIDTNELFEGEQWYSGDHGIFAFQDIPCIAVTSSDMFTDLIKITHTQNDIIENIDMNLLKILRKSIESIIKIIDEA